MLRGKAEAERNGRASCRGQFASRHAFRRERSQGYELNSQRWRSQNGAQTIHERCVADIGRGQAPRSPHIVIGECDWLDRAFAFDCRLKQCGVKVQEMRPLGGRAFGKDSHVTALPQPGIDLRIDYPRVATAATPQENGITFLCQPADHWPGPDFGFGNESHWSRGIQRQDVDPGNVVGNVEASWGAVPEPGVDLNGQDGQGLSSPDLFELIATWYAHTRENEAGHDQPPHEMQGQADEAHRLQCFGCWTVSGHRESQRDTRVLPPLESTRTRSPGRKLSPFFSWTTAIS